MKWISYILATLILVFNFLLIDSANLSMEETKDEVRCTMKCCKAKKETETNSKSCCTTSMCLTTCSPVSIVFINSKEFILKKIKVINNSKKSTFYYSNNYSLLNEHDFWNPPKG